MMKEKNNHNKEVVNKEKYYASEISLKLLFGEIVNQSHKKNVLILRGESSSLSIFLGKYNSLSTLITFCNDNNINFDWSLFRELFVTSNDEENE